MKKIATAGLVAATLLATATAASAQVMCVIPLMISAAIVSAQEHRELTQKEALFCGLIRDEDGAKKAAAAKKTNGKKKTQ